jgi:hypothetical protein
MTLGRRNLRNSVCAGLFACTLAVPWHAEASGLLESIDDPGLNYFALGLLLFVIVLVSYGLIAIHDIPAKIAESRDRVGSSIKSGKRKLPKATNDLA